MIFARRHFVAAVGAGDGGGLPGCGFRAAGDARQRTRKRNAESLTVLVVGNAVLKLEMHVEAIEPPAANQTLERLARQVLVNLFPGLKRFALRHF